MRASTLDLKGTGLQSWLSLTIERKKFVSQLSVAAVGGSCCRSVSRNKKGDRI